MSKKEKIAGVLRKPLIFVLLQNLICLILSLFVFHPHFEENDDTIIAFIAEGVYGTRDSHLVYVNACWGEVLKTLYRLFPDIRWHSVTQYIFMFLALSVICYLLVREKKQGRLLSTIFLLCTFYEAYVSLQYTKTAAIACAAGYFVLLFFLQALRRGEKGRSGIGIVGVLLLIYGFLLRDSCFYMATAIFFIPLLYELWSVWRETEKGSARKPLYIGLVVFALLIVVLGTLGFMNQRAYETDEGWKSYHEFNQKRTELLDYRYDLMNYENYGERLDEMGISENDTLLYLTWQFGDGGVFQIPLIDQVLKDAPNRRFDVAMLKRLAAHLYEEWFGLSALVIGSVCLTLWLLLSGGRKNYFLVLYLLGVLMAVLCYYEYSGRWNHRVVFAVIFTLFVIKLQSCCFDEAKPLLLMIGISLFLNAGLYLQDSFAYHAFVREESSSTEELNAFTMEHANQLYLIDPFTDQIAYRYDVFKAYHEGDFGNRTYLGGWLTHSPIYRGVLKEFGYQDAFEALRSSDTDEAVYLIDNSYPKEKLQYIKEHYQEAFQLKEEETVGNYTIYKLCK